MEGSKVIFLHYLLIFFSTSNNSHFSKILFITTASLALCFINGKSPVAALEFQVHEKNDPITRIFWNSLSYIYQSTSEYKNWFLKNLRTVSGKHLWWKIFVEKPFLNFSGDFFPFFGKTNPWRKYLGEGVLQSEANHKGVIN